MASEIRVDKINSLSGVGTVTLSPTGVDIAGITTVSTLSVGSSVGIGTTNPSSILHVSGSSTPIILNKSTDASPALFIGDSNRDTEGQHLAEFRGRWNGTPVARMVIEAGDDTSNKDNGELTFETAPAGSMIERVRIKSSGDVIVGSGITLSPDGDVFFTGIATGNGSGLTAINTPSFAAGVSGATALSTGSEATIVFNSEDHDTDNAYNTSTGEFTVPSGKGGKYSISVNFGIDDCGEVGDILRLRVLKNGTLLNGFRGQNVQAHANYIITTSVSGTVTLAAGDVIKCMAYTDSNVGDANIEVECTYFSMFRLSI